MAPQMHIQRMISDIQAGNYAICMRKIATSNLTLLEDLGTYAGLLTGLKVKYETRLLWLRQVRLLS